VEVIMRALLLLLLCTTGCFWFTTKGEGQTIKKDVKSLQDQIGTKTKSMDEEIAKLQKTLDDAAKLLKRNSADLGADVDALRKDVQTASGLVAALQNSMSELKTAVDTYKRANDARLDGIEQRLTQIESGKPSPNTSADELWKLGTAAFEGSKYNDAINIYRQLYAQYPTHERADDALYFMGQSFSQLKDWDKAIGAYQKLNEKFPVGSLTDDGLYFAAIAAQNLKQCAEGRAYLSIIKTKHPKSNVIKQANDLDNRLKADQKNKAKCSA
jgi:TolA-binding protein